MALQAQKACEQGVQVMARRRDVMGYVAPADTQPLLDLLGGSKRTFKGCWSSSWLVPAPAAKHQWGSCPRLVAAR